MDPLITFHVLPVPKHGLIQIIVWDRGQGQLGSLDMPTSPGSASGPTSYLALASAFGSTDPSPRKP